MIVAARARRGLSLRARSLFAFAFFSVAIALPIAGARALLRDDAPLETAAVAWPLEGERAVARAERLLAADPQDPRAMADLAFAYLQRARETADASYYGRADELVRRASVIEPRDPAVRLAAAGLALGRHEFAAALEHATATAERSPRSPAARAAVVDALVELGRYDEAVAAAQTLVDLRPDLPSLSRVSYLRELHGDLPGATLAMRRAVAAGAPRGEATAWSEVQLGHLLFAASDIAAAERAYSAALRRVSAYPHALAGLARVSAARGDLAAAAGILENVVGRLPLPEYAATLGDLYAEMGDERRADERYALVEATQRLAAANGVRTDLDLALFDLDHGRRAEPALAAARAEYALRRSVHVAGALAWAEHHAGDLDGAVRHSEEALRLGSADPLLLYRGAVIAQDAGHAGRAQELLARARDLNGAALVLAPDLRARIARLRTP